MPARPLPMSPAMRYGERGSDMNAWSKLHFLATSDPGGPASIELDSEDCGSVVLVYPDGSRGAWYWHDGDWRPSQALNTAPCDVAARGSL